MFRFFRDARYADVQAELKILKAEMEAIDTNMRSLRGLVNNKLSGKRRQKEEEEEEEEEEGDNNSKAISQIVQAFGGDTPIELTDKYKRY